MNRDLFQRLHDEIEARELDRSLSPIDLLSLSDEFHDVLRRIMRRGQTTAEELAQELAEPSDRTTALLAQLEDKGYLSRIPDVSPPRYRVNLGKRRSRQLPEGIWSSLADRLGRTDT